MSNNSHYTKHMHILVTETMHDFVKNDLNGGMGHHIRQMILAYMGNFDKEEAEIKKELAVLEPKYLSLKKKLAEIETEKMRLDDERRTKEKLIEDAHQKLLAELIQAHNRVEDVSRPIIKFWSDKCGESVDALKAWLKEQALIREKA